MEDINDDGGDSTTMTKRENGRQDSRTRVCHANSTTKEQSHSFALGKNVPNKRHIDQLAALGPLGNVHRAPPRARQRQSLHPNIVGPDGHHGTQIIVAVDAAAGPHLPSADGALVPVPLLHALQKDLLGEFQRRFLVGLGDGERAQEDVRPGSQGADGQGGLHHRAERRPRIDGDALARGGRGRRGERGQHSHR